MENSVKIPDFVYYVGDIKGLKEFLSELVGAEKRIKANIKQIPVKNMDIHIGDKVKIIADKNNALSHERERGESIGEITEVVEITDWSEYPIRTTYRDKRGWAVCFGFDEVEKVFN